MNGRNKNIGPIRKVHNLFLKKKKKVHNQTKNGQNENFKI